MDSIAISEQFSQAGGTLFPDFKAFTQIIWLAILAGLTLSPIETLVPAHKQNTFYRKGILLDLVYWFVTPIITRFFTGLIIGALIYLIFYLLGLKSISISSALMGFGPISRQPGWIQTIEILMIADFIDYWTHRTFHFSRFWKIHAIHHTAEDMSWLSASRLHPLNDLTTRSFQIIPIVLLGFSGSTILTILPLVSFYVMFLHSNIRWDFGPFRWILVSPAYHRWHHTSDEEGLDKNFAGIFPIWDLIFGTAYFPKKLPTKYGLRNQFIPESLTAQLMFPFSSSNSREL